MKSFGQYILENMGDDLSSDTRTDLNATDPTDQSILAACKVAISVSKPELLQFLRDLSNKFSEVKDALAGVKPSEEPEEVTPSSPDITSPATEF